MPSRTVFTLLLCLLVAGVCHAAPRRIGSFQELMTSLEAGFPVSAVFHYKYCLLDGGQVPAPDAVGGSTMCVYEYFAPGVAGNKLAFVGFSDNQFIYHSSYGYVNNYVKTRVYDDNHVEILAQYLDPLTVAVRMNETFTCTIKGTTGGAEFFYQE